MMIVKPKNKVILPLKLYEMMWTLLHITKEPEITHALMDIDIGKDYLHKINKTLKRCNRVAIKYIEVPDEQTKTKAVRSK